MNHFPLLHTIFNELGQPSKVSLTLSIVTLLLMHFFKKLKKKYNHIVKKIDHIDSKINELERLLKDKKED